MFIYINKPAGWTSHDVVAHIREKYKKENSKIKVGHAGTLDPFATGLLIIGVGRESTKKLDEFKKLPKTYIATLKLGEVSDTFDKTGKIMSPTAHTPLPPSQGGIDDALKKFTGKQLQIPPMFSAKKINGKKLYELARKGIEIERKPSEIEIYSIKMLEYSWPLLKLVIECSSGTYIRSLANDIGAKFGVGAYCEELVRTKIGQISLDEAVNINTIHYV